MLKEQEKIISGSNSAGTTQAIQNTGFALERIENLFNA